VSETVIKVENLAKKYVLSHQQKGQNYKSLREVIADSAKSLGKKFLKPYGTKIDDPTYEEFWALRDVSFEIKQGDRVGIIGRNGAGKSTLLKILSRVTEPTSGQINIKGRVASLLEVGTGFHPELTGRENVFLNGAILGMSQAEINRKFDEIVAFAEVEKFLDTPVKRYSSGMYVRLAFAVAAHLEPEILIVDEVLAVGDIKFQKKCLGKMQDVSTNEGRTVLFVSHNTDAIQRLCSKCLMMEDGRTVDYDNTYNVMSHYLSSYTYQASPKEWIDTSRLRRSNGNGKARFTAVQYNSFNDAVVSSPYSDGPLEFLLNIESNFSISDVRLSVIIYNQTGTKLINADTRCIGQSINLQKGTNLIQLKIESLHLIPGVYTIGLWLADSLARMAFDFIESAFEFEVIDLKEGGLDFGMQSEGFVSCKFKFLPITQTDEKLYQKQTY
jgi:lipopolysaccharide transport system ATP-binding protein